MELIGYKSFNKGLINRYGKKFEVGKIYIAPEIIKFGNKGNGYHLCKNIEDTFRYFSNFKQEIDVCLVKGTGNYCLYEDEYYGYYDMYSFEKIEILKKLNYSEIIELGLNLNDVRVRRFISTFKLNPKEIEMFKKKYRNNIGVIDTIAYYQENNKKVYEKNIKNKYTRI